MWRLRTLVSLIFLLPSVAWADTLAQTRYIPSIGWSLDAVDDLTSAGTVTGTSVAFTELISCSTVASDANGNFYCSTIAGSGTVTSISQGTNMSFSANPITTTGTINLTASPSVTNLTASGTVTGAVVSATTALQVGSDYITDITGTGLSISGGVLNASGGTTHAILSATHTDSVANTVSRGSLIYGNSTPGWDELVVGAANSVLTADGTDAVWSASPTVTNLTATNTVTGAAVATTQVICAGTDKLSTDTGGNFVCKTDQTGGGSSHDILSATHTDSVAGTVSRGALIYGNSTPAWDDLAVGGANTLLSADGTDVAWTGTPTVTSLTATNTVTGQIVVSSPRIQMGANATTTGQLVMYSGSVSTLPTFLQGGAATTSATLTLPRTGGTNGQVLTSLGSGVMEWKTNPSREFVFSASSLEPLEAADSIPPLTKTTGTNLDEFSISFDSATDEGRKVTLLVPERVDTTGTVTFTFYWWSAGQTVGNVVWDVRYTSTGQDGEDWDQSLTTLSNTCAVATNTEDFDLCRVTQTISTLGWVAGDRITLMLYRNGDAAGDNMSGDAQLSTFLVSVPVS